MPGPIVIPNCVEVRLRWSVNGVLGLNVLHAQYTLAGPLSPTVGESIFAAIKAAAATTTWLTHVAGTSSLLGVDVKDLRAPNNPVLSSTGAGAVGTGTGNAMPGSVAIAITLRTANSGRGFRGRVFLGGLVVAAGDLNGRIVSAVNTDGVAFITAVSAALSSQSMTLAIGQKALPARPSKPGGELPARPANVVPVTGIVARDTRFDTQRRRLQ